MNSARVVKDSISYRGHRLTTLVVKMHRFVLAEFNTHRMFSRSSASSRAIPVDRQLQNLILHPAFPLEWRGEQPGMQGGLELEGADYADARDLFEQAHALTADLINQYLIAHPEKPTRLHKSLINRLMEPFMWHEVIVSSTEWENFFRQRCSPLAQPEFRIVAEQMRDAIENSQPVTLGYQDWHMPFIDEDEGEHIELEEVGVDPRIISAARCAQISYRNPETGEKDVAKDLERWERLVNPGEGPPHAAPLEMVARPCPPDIIPAGNFYGWAQLRHDVLGF